MLGRVFHGSVAGLVAQLLETEDVPPEELRRRTGKETLEDIKGCLFAQSTGGNTAQSQPQPKRDRILRDCIANLRGVIPDRGKILVPRLARMNVEAIPEVNRRITLNFHDDSERRCLL